ncbi:hypothetical protein LMG19083_02412 [Ralstonia psammae]|uniref:Uncharacterized protein n=1 Tax=Ralstonia psammae TaxID=3058598 RepID=A0ABN9IUG0_9RALS|nr:hypothetical protein LMG19083_02412 [Ralstonia sp. LMG 19083]
MKTRRGRHAVRSKMHWSGALSAFATRSAHAETRSGNKGQEASLLVQWFWSPLP